MYAPAHQNYGNQALPDSVTEPSAAGSAEKITYYEEARLHQKFAPWQRHLDGDAAADTADQTLVFVADASPAAIDSDICQYPMKGDILLINGKDRLVVITGTANSSTGLRARESANRCCYRNNVFEMPVIGNIFDEAASSRRFVESTVRYQKPYAIVKGNFEVTGSQATNIGYIDVGGGDYSCTSRVRWMPVSVSWTSVR